MIGCADFSSTYDAYSPYPTADVFLKQLELADADPETLRHYINQYDLDPFGHRSKAGALKEQFSTENVQRVVMNIKTSLRYGIQPKSG